ncbi:MAG TPA: ATP-binding protein [Candidatus Obscuribacterales bacterium]
MSFNDANKRNSSLFKEPPEVYRGSIVAFMVASICTTVVLMLAGVLNRQELQAINNRFEARMWIMWAPESLERVDVSKILAYHREHELNKSWLVWDQTLSWLLENNHPPAKHKIVAFNRLPEDEPPIEAVKSHRWMRPLMHFPLPRYAVALMVDYLSTEGARMIILDNDFPQYSEDDQTLALAIHRAAHGHEGRRPVPVFFARTISRRSSDRAFLQAEPTVPHGLLRELGKLERGVDVREKYTGITCVLPDEDQVVRRAVIKLEHPSGQIYTSIAGKAVSHLGEAKALPDVIDIDFAAPPNSRLYPVRPLWYLLDPDQRRRMCDPESNDVTIKDAIVVIGDSIVDVFSTPLTNFGLDQMSGSEVLIHSMETLSRRSWFKRLDGDRLDGPISIIFGIEMNALCAALWWLSKVLQLRAAKPLSIGDFKTTHTARPWRIALSVLALFVMVVTLYMVALLLFAYCHLIVPLVVPSVAVISGTLAAEVWEHEREREISFQTKLEAANEKLAHAKEKYESDLKRKEAEATAREVLLDRERRKEFVRRINHDLNAPVSVLNWTLAELGEENLTSAEGREKVKRLMKNSDRLCELIDQLVQTYDYDAAPVNGNEEGDHCDLAQAVKDCLDSQKPLAGARNALLEFDAPSRSIEVNGGRLQISRLLDNLIRNALKHNPPGTRVKVMLEDDGEICLLQVADNGRGIAAQDLKLIFDAGYRASNSESEGQGLGLDIVKTLVEGLDGQISVESEVGKGTTFSVKLRRFSDNKEGG